MAQKLFLLPGDGIGTEIMKEVEKVILWLNSQGETDFELDTGLVGGSAYDKYGVAVSEEDMQKALAADAVIFGAVGGPKWDKVAYDVRPEAGLLRLRKDLQLFANVGYESRVPTPLAGILRDRMIASLAKGRDEMDWTSFALEVSESAGL